LRRRRVPPEGHGAAAFCRAKMAVDPVTRRWWQLTDPCQEQTEGAVPGEWWTPMREVFHHG